MTKRKDQGRLFDPDRRLTARMRRATDATVRELRAGGRLEPVDVGRVAMLRTIADLIDDELLAGPDGNKWTVARLAGEWRALHAEVRGDQDSGWDAAAAAFFDDGDPALRDGP